MQLPAGFINPLGQPRLANWLHGAYHEFAPIGPRLKSNYRWNDTLGP
jgi:hypothetical protein